jgi:hypothetical protein
VLRQVARTGLRKGKTIGIYATTLEANAAMKSIVRRDTEESYTEYLSRLADAAGLEASDEGGTATHGPTAQEERFECGVGEPA